MELKDVTGIVFSAIGCDQTSNAAADGRIAIHYESFSDLNTGSTVCPLNSKIIILLIIK